MNKHKQRIHILLCKHDDERRLLHSWRINNDFYSTIPGSRSHRSYHSDGRVHTKIEDWGDYNHYQDIEFKDSPDTIKDVVIIQGLITRAEERHHSLDSEFIRMEKSAREGDLVIKIKTEEMDENSLFAVAICAAANQKMIDRYIQAIKHAGDLEVLAIESQPRLGDSVLFSVAFTEKCGASFSKGISYAFGWGNYSVLVPLAGTYSVLHGNTQLFAIPIKADINNEKRPPPFHKNPPYLPYRLGPWMTKHSCKIKVSRLKHIWTEVGKLSICALYKKNLRGQQLIVAIPTTNLNRKNLFIFNNSNCYTVLLSDDYKIVSFQFGPVGGYLIQQFNFDDLKFQMEIKSVLGANGYDYPNCEKRDEPPDEYGIEVIEITEEILDTV